MYAITMKIVFPLFFGLCDILDLIFSIFFMIYPIRSKKAIRSPSFYGALVVNPVVLHFSV